MNDLFLRTQIDRELTWEELDTNWMRIKNAVDELEQSLEDTRTNKEWILPLILDEFGSGNITLNSYPYAPEINSDPVCGFFYDAANVMAGIYIARDGVSHDLLSIGIGSTSDDYTAIINNNWNEGAPELNCRIIQHTPLSSVQMRVEPGEAYINLLTSRMLTVRDDNGVPRLGFFYAHAPQQSIAKTSSDPAITELQNILIAYGLALDNRNP